MFFLTGKIHRLGVGFSWYDRRTQVYWVWGK